MKVFNVLFSLCCAATPFSAMGETWQASVTETAIARSPFQARDLAARSAGLQLTPKYSVCTDLSGTASHTLEAGSCSPSGMEDFRCSSRAHFSCDMGDIEYISGSPSLEGMYFDAAEHAFITIDSQRSIRGSLVAPYSGGKAFTQMSNLARTGESTYRATGSFTAVSGQCQGQAEVEITKLSDGNLIVQITSQERVVSIIFGICNWSGTLTSSFELRPFRQL